MWQTFGAVLRAQSAIRISTMELKGGNAYEADFSRGRGWCRGLQLSVSLTTVVGGVTQTIGSNWCTDSSTSEFSCTASAYCEGTNYYGGFVDAVETNATDYTTEATWNQPPVWVGC